MSRELKFRVWEEREKAYNTWSYILDTIGNLFRNAYGALIGCDKKDYIVEQYTGLKDKSGKEIYEGDILQDSKGECCRVEWNEKEAHFGLYTNRQFELTDFVWMRGEDVEVIGNINENSELLGGKNE